MKILYKQPDSALNQGILPFFSMGIEHCYLKQLFIERDFVHVTKKVHHHRGFEIHIVSDGYQVYESNGKTYKIDSNHFLIIPPEVSHKVIESAPQTLKYSITFNILEKHTLPFDFSGSESCVASEIPSYVNENIRFIAEEADLKRSFSSLLVANRVCETVVLLFRAAGFKDFAAQKTFTDEDARINIAKQYIKDNICQALTVMDVASYCYLSKKQLTRLFLHSENTTPGLYIQKKRIDYIESLLSDDTLTLREISEKMNFSSEYYFNSFFKKYVGMPPGEYRKMLK